MKLTEARTRVLENFARIGVKGGRPKGPDLTTTFSLASIRYVEPFRARDKLSTQYRITDLGRRALEQSQSQSQSQSQEGK